MEKLCLVANGQFNSHYVHDVCYAVCSERQEVQWNLGNKDHKQLI